MDNDVLKILGLSPSPQTTDPDGKTDALVPAASVNHPELFQLEDDSPNLQPLDPNTERIQRDADYVESRQRSRQLNKVANHALEGVLQIADSSGSPRAYEVVAQLLKNASEINRDLMDLHVKRQKLREADDDDDGPKSRGGTTIEKAIVFQGNSRDLLKMAKELTRQDDPCPSPTIGNVIDVQEEKES